MKKYLWMPSAAVVIGALKVQHSIITNSASLLNWSKLLKEEVPPLGETSFRLPVDSILKLLCC